jgi:hypothetical protein
MFLDETDDALAFRLLRFFAYFLEDLTKPLHLVFCLFSVRAKSLLQLRTARLPLVLSQSLHQPLLSVKNILQLMNE